MSELGWQPDEVDVKRSKVESKVADIIEGDSLTNLKIKSDSSEISEEMAKSIRASKGDVRLDTTSAEQQRANQITDAVTWVIVGIAVAITLGGVLLSLVFGLIKF